jgi:elongator complex protein 4
VPSRQPEMKSSFKKKHVKMGVSFAVSNETEKGTFGVKLSIQNGLPLTSTGIPSIDDVFGGGLPLGSVLLIKEDRSTSYATTMLQYFLAQGAVQIQQEASKLVIVSADKMDLLETLPWLHIKRQTDNGLDQKKQKLDEKVDDMTIAWRYKNQPKISSEISVSQIQHGYCNTFDLTTRIPPSALSQVKENTIQINPRGSNLEQIMSHFPQTTSGPPIRIAISSFASPNWTGWKETELVRFLLNLRQVVRRHSAVAVVTVPAYLYGDAPGLGVNKLVRRWEHLADAVLEVESFEGTLCPDIALTIGRNGSTSTRSVCSRLPWIALRSTIIPS